MYWLESPSWKAGDFNDRYHPKAAETASDARLAQRSHFTGTLAAICLS
jgi:hypothetical protein